MLKAYNMRFYLYNVLHMAVVNKVRLILTAIGLFTAVFLYATGMIMAESYYNSNLRALDEMEPFSVVLKNDKSALPYIEKTLREYVDYLAIQDCAEGGSGTNVLKILNSTETGRIILSARYHGTDGGHFCPTFDGSDRYMPIPAKLKEGRLLSPQDIEERASVVVIDELTAEILFPGETAVGKELTLKVDQRLEGNEAYVRAEIIGIVGNNLVSYTNREKLKRLVNSKGKPSENVLRITTDVYCPFGFLSDNDLLSAYHLSEEIYSVYVFSDEKTYHIFTEKAVSMVENARDRSMNIDVSTMDTYRKELEDDFSDTRTILNFVTLLLCIISGISIMSISFFAVKERITEIGIRKAFGADRIDILFQIVFEMVFVAIIVSLVALLSSMIICKVVAGYFQSSIMMLFQIKISNYRLFLPMAVGVLEAAVCSLLPALYASRIKVVDALRFE